MKSQLFDFLHCVTDVSPPAGGIIPVTLHLTDCSTEITFMDLLNWREAKYENSV